MERSPTLLADNTYNYNIGTVATYSCNHGYGLVINPVSEMRTVWMLVMVAALYSVDRHQLANVSNELRYSIHLLIHAGYCYIYIR